MIGDLGRRVDDNELEVIEMEDSGEEPEHIHTEHPPHRDVVVRTLPCTIVYNISTFHHNL